MKKATGPKPHDRSPMDKLPPMKKAGKSKKKGKKC
jgi:hypothetical protein